MIGDIAEVQLGRQRSPQHHAGPARRPYLRSANVTWDGISLDDVKEMNFGDADFKTFKLSLRGNVGRGWLRVPEQGSRPCWNR